MVSALAFVSLVGTMAAAHGRLDRVDRIARPSVAAREHFVRPERPAIQLQRPAADRPMRMAAPAAPSRLRAKGEIFDAARVGTYRGQSSGSSFAAGRGAMQQKVAQRIQPAIRCADGMSCGSASLGKGVIRPANAGDRMHVAGAMHVATPAKSQNGTGQALQEMRVKIKNFKVLLRLNSRIANKNKQTDAYSAWAP
jgi:hypothetical protein